MKSTLADLLAPFREADQRATAIAAGDAAACKMLAAWPNLVLPTWKCPRIVMPEDAPRRWLWIWSGFLGGPDEPVFLADLGRRACVAERDVLERWPALVGARLLFPDGTLAVAAEEMVRSYIRRNQRRSDSVKRIGLSLNGHLLYVYVEGDCDRVQLGREGQSPMNRDDSIDVSDRITAKHAESGEPTVVDATLTLSVGNVEDL